MRLRWVGDARDYVKWDCVFGNAEGRFVLYVPMLRRTDPACHHDKVQKHFDQTKDLAQFGSLFPGRFEAFDFDGREYSRVVADVYFELVVRRIKHLHSWGRLLVFIDPDTGLEPQSGAKDEHLRAEDLCAIWAVLRRGDKLVVYQHASRTEGWEQNLATRASSLLHLHFPPATYCDTRLAGDVCFLIIEKPGQ